MSDWAQMSDKMVAHFGDQIINWVIARSQEGCEWSVLSQENWDDLGNQDPIHHMDCSDDPKPMVVLTRFTGTAEEANGVYRELQEQTSEVDIWVEEGGHYKVTSDGELLGFVGVSWEGFIPIPQPKGCLCGAPSCSPHKDLGSAVGYLVSNHG